MLKQPSLLDLLTGPPPPPPPSKEDLLGLLKDAREERQKVFDEEGYFAATRRAQMEAISGLFGGGSSPPPPSPSASRAPSLAPAMQVSPTSGPSAAAAERVAPCARDEPGCVESDLQASRTSGTAYMVPWAFPVGPKGISRAAEELQRALKRQGGGQVRTRPAGGSSLFVTASFGWGPLGLPLFHDDFEFLLDDSGATDVPGAQTFGHATFRAAASSDGFPFSTSRSGAIRNRDRLLRVRKELFGRSAWRCDCPEELGAFGDLKCAVFCT